MSSPFPTQFCAHNGARFPARPIPDHWTVCPDCGVKVARRGGRIITVYENNEAVALERLRPAIEAFKRGVRFRDTTSAPLPTDAEIIAKLDEDWR